MASTQSGNESPGSKPPIWEAFLIVGGLALAAIALFWWVRSQVRSEPTKGGSSARRVDPKYALYVGDKTCARCHAVESARHMGSGHSHTLRAASSLDALQQLDGREAADPELPEIRWRFSRQNGQFAAEREEQGKWERHLIEYVFGSGRHATTFVSLLNRDPDHLSGLEHRLSIFAHDGSIAMTPGQVESSKLAGNTPHGRVLTSRETLLCFGCHTTVTSDRGSEFLDERTMIPNVSCERCHGPGKNHVLAAERGAPVGELAMPFGPGHWTAREQMELCGQCHRLPSMVQPPEELRPDNPILVRFQPVGLMQSACYLGSEGRLSCLNCHDAHARPSTDRPSYESACLSCHKQAPQTTCSVSPKSGCIECHMPRVTTTRNMVVTDHWIRSRPEPTGQPRPESSGPAETPRAEGTPRK